MNISLVLQILRRWKALLRMTLAIRKCRISGASVSETCLARWNAGSLAGRPLPLQKK